jgi:hypothetical protein
MKRLYAIVASLRWLGGIGGRKFLHPIPCSTTFPSLAHLQRLLINLLIPAIILRIKLLEPI